MEIPTYSSIVREQRFKKGIRNRAVAKSTNVSESYLLKAEKGQLHIYREEIIRAVARQLDLDPDELVLFSDKFPLHMTLAIKQDLKLFHLIKTLIGMNKKQRKQVIKYVEGLREEEGHA